MPDTTIFVDEAPTLPPFAALERSHIGVVIEDDVATRRMLMRAMREVPLTAIGFGSAEAALVWLEMNAAPDLVSMDVGLHGMDGLRACELMRANPRLADVPLIVCTAQSHPEDEARALLAGASFITKPFSVRDYIGAARKAVNARAAHAVRARPPLVGAG